MRMQDNYDEARSTLEEARREFESIGNRLGAAQCLESISEASGNRRCPLWALCALWKGVKVVKAVKVGCTLQR